MNQAIALKPNRNIITIIVIAFAIFAGGPLALHLVSLSIRNKIATGLLADFTITFPVLYYFIILKPLKKPVKSLLLVISVCCAFAYLVLPAHQREYILQIRKVSVVAELIILIYAISRFNKIRSSYKTYQSNFADAVFNLKSAMADVMGNTVIVNVLSAELAVLRYGLLSWKKEKGLVQNDVFFTTYKDSGYVAMWSIILFAMLIEISAVHLLLGKWSNTAANIVTSVTAYGFIFFIADLSAMVKRKLIIRGNKIVLRTGLRWQTITELNNISSIEKIANDYSSGEEYLKGGILKNSGNLLITFKKPVVVQKLYAQSKNVSAILMNIDDADTFITYINQNNRY